MEVFFVRFIVIINCRSKVTVFIVVLFCFFKFKTCALFAAYKRSNTFVRTHVRNRFIDKTVTGSSESIRALHRLPRESRNDNDTWIGFRDICENFHIYTRHDHVRYDQSASR